jgi:hypothetical protein
MAHIVVNGSAFTGTPGRETLPEMAQSLSGTLGEFQAALARIWSSLPGSVHRHTRFALRGDLQMLHLATGTGIICPGE